MTEEKIKLIIENDLKHRFKDIELTKEEIEDLKNITEFLRPKIFKKLEKL